MRLNSSTFIRSAMSFMLVFAYAAKPANGDLTYSFVAFSERAVLDGTELFAFEPVTGIVAFDFLDPGDSATNVSATTVAITFVPEFLEQQFDDDYGFRLNENILESPDLELDAPFLSEPLRNSWNIVDGEIEMPDDREAFHAMALNGGMASSGDHGFEFFKMDIFGGFLIANNDIDSVNGSTTGDDFVNFATPVFIAIPEPSSVSFLGLMAVVVMLRRRLKLR